MVYDESRQSGFVDKNIAEFHFVLKNNISIRFLCSFKGSEIPG